jgi:hypothetical protein
VLNACSLALIFFPGDCEAPLSQINLVPDFMQVKVFAPTTDLTPTFVHFAPALAAA